MCGRTRDNGIDSEGFSHEAPPASHGKAAGREGSSCSLLRAPRSLGLLRSTHLCGPACSFIYGLVCGSSSRVHTGELVLLGVRSVHLEPQGLSESLPVRDNDIMNDAQRLRCPCCRRLTDVRSVLWETEEIDQGWN